MKEQGTVYDSSGDELEDLKKALEQMGIGMEVSEPEKISKLEFEQAVIESVEWHLSKALSLQTQLDKTRRDEVLGLRVDYYKIEQEDGKNSYFYKSQEKETGFKLPHHDD